MASLESILDDIESKVIPEGNRASESTGMTKRCSRCHVIQSISAFSACVKERDGKKYTCKKCDSLAKTLPKKITRMFLVCWFAQHPEEIALYYVWNKRRQRQRNDRYRTTHLEESRAWERIRARRSYAKDRRKHKLRKAASRLNPLILAKQQARGRKYFASHRPEAYARKIARHARQRHVLVNDFTHAQWVAMQEHYNHCCVYCGKRCKGKLTRDHITPLIKGGNHTASNIVPACRSCNSKKGTQEVLVPVQPLLLLVS